jgi:hypothetical protein
MKKFEPRIFSVDGASMEAVMVESPNIIPNLDYYVPADLAEGMLEVLKETAEELQFCRDEKHSPSKDLIKEIQSIIAKAEEAA